MILGTPNIAHNLNTPTSFVSDIQNTASSNSSKFAGALETPIANYYLTPLVSKGNDTGETSENRRTPVNFTPKHNISIKEPYTPQTHDPDKILQELRVKYTNNVVIGHLNINSLANKFDALSLIIKDKLDIFVICETKLDMSYPEKQFYLEGYRSYRLDRNKFGGGVMVYVRSDIPSNMLQKHTFSKKIEALFIEINLRKRKLLLVGTYHSTHYEYGTNDNDFFEQIGFALDIYSNYDKFLLAGDFNVVEEAPSMQEFLEAFGAKNLVKEDTCFKSMENPSCIDLFLTNSPLSFQNTTTLSTGLSDFHKMIVTVLKTTFPKSRPKILTYRDFSKYIETDFRTDLRKNISEIRDKTYRSFEDAFLHVLNKHAPNKIKVMRANQKPYMTKQLRKAIMKRSYLKNRVYKHGTPTENQAYKKQKNYCNRLYKRERRKFYSNLNLNKITDNKKFWNTMKPLFSDKGVGGENIILVDNDKIISEDQEVAQKFNTFFKNAVTSLGIEENRFLLTETKGNESNVDEAIVKFDNHPSIISIKEKVDVKQRFSFSKISAETIKYEIDHLDQKKPGTLMNIPSEQLKKVIDIVSEPLMHIWNNEIVQNKIFPANLKLADISPIFKKLKNTLVDNYRPVSVLPTVSKIFERIMQKQMNTFVENFLSPYLCGYRKGYNSQYALLAMIEKWKLSLDNGEYAGGILMDLSKAFDTINHQLLIAKLYAYGFSKNALELLSDYLKNRWQRTKINASFSTWTELMSGVPQGSILGPILFNIYLNDLLYQFTLTDVCNLADDTTPYTCDIDLTYLLSKLESEAITAIMWFEANYMKLNPDKCHFLITGNTPECLWTKVGDEIIWESRSNKLLGIVIDNKLNFNEHLTILCKKASAKVTALARLVKIIPMKKKRILMKSFIQSQFSYCPLIWMFCSRKINNRINYIHERALRLVYNDYNSSFDDLLQNDNSVCIHHQNIQKVAIEMFKVVNGLCPETLQNLFQRAPGLTRSQACFIRPKVKTVRNGQQSLRSFGPLVWDTMLPTSFKEIVDLESFKKAIKNWKPDNCTCRLCKTFVKNIGFITTK